MNEHDFRSMRRNYGKSELVETQISPNAFDQISHWFKEAKASGILEPNAMSLATASKSGHPRNRIVLLKEINATGLVFFTNYLSQKGQDLEENPYASALFFWDKEERQVRFDGKVEKISREESEAYFLSRPFESQIGAHASIQSSTIPNREFVESKYEDMKEKYSGQIVPIPDYWGGYILIPEVIEFWQGRSSRLHDRIEYKKSNNQWTINRLSP